MPKAKRPKKTKESGKTNWFKKPKNKYLLVLLFAALLIVVDVTIIIQHEIAIHKRNQFIKQQEDAIGTKNVPSSVKPSPKAIAAYNVPPTLPKYLIIPAINVKARVYKLYTNAQDQIEAPDNIYDTGWYTGSSLPGQPGAMFIDGHVSSWTADGVFYNLKKLKPGDIIQVQRGDNKVYTYVVNKLIDYGNTNVNMTQALSPINPNTSALNLMTCTGSVISGTSEFNQRLVVYSTLQT
jgi:LPXTG-site transpeptidase (sortase) family protein